MPSNVISEVVVNGNTYGIAASDAVPNLATVEPDATSASKAYTVGEHVVVDDIYYKVIDDIETGDAFIVNTNIEVAKVGDEIERINQHLSEKVSASNFDIETIESSSFTVSSNANYSGTIDLSNVTGKVIGIVGYNNSVDGGGQYLTKAKITNSGLEFKVRNSAASSQTYKMIFDILVIN